MEIIETSQNNMQNRSGSSVILEQSSLRLISFINSSLSVNYIFLNDTSCDLSDAKEICRFFFVHSMKRIDSMLLRVRLIEDHRRLPGVAHKSTGEHALMFLRQTDGIMKSICVTEQTHSNMKSIC